MSDDKPKSVLDRGKLIALITEVSNAGFDCGLDKENESPYSYRILHDKAVAARKDLLDFVDAIVKTLLGDLVQQSALTQGAISLAQHWKSNHDNMVKKCALLSQRDDLPVDRLPAYQELERLQQEMDALKIHIDQIIDIERKRARAALVEELRTYANQHFDQITATCVANELAALVKEKK